MILIRISEDYYLLQFRKKYSLTDMYKRAKVIPQSYAGSFVRELYEMIFTEIPGSSDEYELYYRDEYQHIHDFFFWKYYVPYEDFSKLDGNVIGYIRVFRLPMAIYEEGQIADSWFDLLKEFE